LQFLYRVTLGMDWVVEEVACPKVPKRLPVILSPDELVRFFKAANNLKLVFYSNNPNCLVVTTYVNSPDRRKSLSSKTLWRLVPRN
jgi:hypothetical protein